jgi:two-component system response regulator GlrR
MPAIGAHVDRHPAGSGNSLFLLDYCTKRSTHSEARTAPSTRSDDSLNKIRCIIVASREREGIAAIAAECVRALDSERFEILLRTGDPEIPECEILIPVVDVHSYQHVTADIVSLRQRSPATATLALTLNLSEQQLRGLLCSGVQDFSPAPFNSNDFRIRLQRAAGLLVPRPQPTAVRSMLCNQLQDFVGNSPPFIRVLSMLPRIAGCDASVLLLGETGTGKEVCARAIHYMSARASRPWVAVNCGALPPDLVEAELFGHVRGAFTNAHCARVGLIQEAEGGCLFLDEVDSMPLIAQCKLLRFLQDKQYRQVGSSQTLQANVRIIAASNRNLAKLAADGAFRQDLFFRLNVLSLLLPPLRERREDIAALCNYFLEQFSRRDRRPLLALGPAALQPLLAHDWPGNVRELKHVLERAALTADGPIIQADTIDLPATSAPDGSPGESFHSAKGRVVESFERHYIQQLLRQCDGNVSRAARVAQKNRRAFFELMRKHKIRSDRSSSTDHTGT